MHNLTQYAEEMQRVVANLPLHSLNAMVDVLYDAWAMRRQVFIMGNGGSASTASHFVCDLAKNTRIHGSPPLRVSAFGDNMALFSAFANDEGYENVFAGSLATMMSPGDVVIGISTSGNSANVLRAIEKANELGGYTIAFTNMHGGELAQLARLVIRVPTTRIEIVEDIHLMYEHMVTSSLRDRLKQQMETKTERLVSAI